jgi:hypothetical protein
VASDGVKTIQKQLKINWLFNFYYGVGPDWSSFLSNQDKVNFIKNTVTMTPVLTNKKTRSVSVICGDDQYVYYAYPSSYGDVSFYYNGVSGGFDKIDTIYVGNVYDPSGALQPYCVWRSVNPDLGNLSVNIE